MEKIMTSGTHADLVARLEELASKNGCFSAAYENCIEQGAPQADMCLTCAAATAAKALVALPPPTDPPKVCPECGDPLSCIACEAKEDARPEWRTSFGWMIEARFSGVPHWFEGIGGNSSGSTYLWTTDPARGIRLCRREDVVALIDSLNEGASVPMRGYPLQHGWCDLRPEVVTPIGAQRPVAPPAPVALLKDTADALWGMQMEPGCWCPPGISVGDYHTDACRDARAVSKRLLAYPLPAAPPVTDTPQGAELSASEAP